MSVPTFDKFGVPSPEGEALKLLQPKVPYRFRVRVTDFGDPDDVQGALDITRQVQSVGRPSLQISEQVLDVYNSKAYYQGKHTWQPVEMTLRDDISNTVSKKVAEQMQKQINHFEQSKPIAGSNYKFSMRIETLDGSNNAFGGGISSIIDQWILEGCFITNFGYGQHDYSTETPLTITLNVRYDNALHYGIGGENPIFPEEEIINSGEDASEGNLTAG